VRDEDKPRILPAIRLLAELGFKVLATGGTARFLAENGISATKINKVLEGRPHIEDAIRNRQVQLVINTTELEVAAPRHADAEGALLHHHGRRRSRRPGNQGAEGRKPRSPAAAELFLR
jgi:hypothetical protein